MASVKSLQLSFSGGEVTPEFFGRIDDPKFRSGAARMRNMIALPHGPAVNRAGTQYVRATKHSGSKKCRLIRFAYSTTQTMVLEVGEGYFRFHSQGGTLMAPASSPWSAVTAYSRGDLVFSGGLLYYCLAKNTNQVPPNTAYWYALPTSGEYEIPNNYAEADIFDLKYVQSADVLTLVHPAHPPAELRRYGATNWQFVPVTFGASIPPPTAVITAGTPITHSYKVTALRQGAAFGVPQEETLPSALASCSSDLEVSGTFNKIQWAAMVDALGYKIYKSNGTVYGYLGSSSTNSFEDTRYKQLDPSTQPPTNTTAAGPSSVTATAVTPSMVGVAVNATVPAGATGLSVQWYAVTCLSEDGSESIASETIGVYNNLNYSGAYNTITWPAIPGAQSYYVYKYAGGSLAYIGQSSVLSFEDNNITPDTSKTPPRYDNPFIGESKYPAAVAYFEQRRWFAGALDTPQTVWGTRSGSESNMSYSIPVRDDDRIKVRIAAREADRVKHLVPLSSLLAFTDAAEWRITSVNSDAVTPTSISARAQSYVGANDMQPITVNASVLYCAARGGHIRELGYSWQSSGFVSNDLSLRAPHLFDRLDVVDGAYSKAPYPIAWFVSTNGKLLGLTYIPEQQVAAWHWHDTDGVIESCASVAEGAEDILYLVVKRTINGSDVRYVERMRERYFSDQADAFFVDCGLTYSGSPATTISGLSHLEGKTVNILADGAEHPQRVVTSGAIALDNPASKVQVGIPIDADLYTLPLAMQIDGAFGQGRVKNINKVWVRVHESGGIFAGPDENNLTEAKQRTTEIYGEPPSLKSEEIEISLTPSWQDGGQVFIRQSKPLPLTVLGLTVEVALGG